MTTITARPVNFLSGEMHAPAGLKLLILTLVASTPFWHTGIATTGLFGIEALRLSNILPVVVFLVFCTQRNAFHISDRVERAATLAFLAYLVLFTIAFLRSVQNLPRFHALDPAGYPTNFRSYFDAYYVVRILGAMSFFYVLRTMRTAEDLTKLFSALGFSVFVLSCVILAAVINHPDALSTPNRAGMADLMGSLLGLHYNDAVAPYIIAGPLLLHMAMKLGRFWRLNYILAMAAVLCLESRTGIVVFFGMSIVTFFVARRARILIATAPIVVVAVLIAIGPTLFDILSIGFSKSSGFSLFYFLSGRDEAIWVPLMQEWWNDPSRFWFGAGEQSIMTSDMLLTGRMLAVARAHNAYLEFFLDDGIFLFGLLVGVLVVFVTWAYRVGRRLQVRIYWILFLCILCFLLGSFTARRFFPYTEDMFMFSIIAAFVNVLRIKQLDNVLSEKVRRSSRAEFAV